MLVVDMSLLIWYYHLLNVTIDSSAECESGLWCCNPGSNKAASETKGQEEEKEASWMSLVSIALTFLHLGSLASVPWASVFNIRCMRHCLPMSKSRNNTVLKRYLDDNEGKITCYSYLLYLSDQPVYIALQKCHLREEARVSEVRVVTFKRCASFRIILSDSSTANTFSLTAYHVCFVAHTRFFFVSSRLFFLLMCVDL